MFRFLAALFTNGLHIRGPKVGVTLCGLLYLNHGFTTEATIGSTHWAAKLACRECSRTLKAALGRPA